MIKYSIDGPTIHIETDAIKADIRTEGYTSGVAAGSFLDKKTGARDVGFGLSIVDFLLEPADASKPIEPGQYEYGDKFAAYHGDIPKRYVEGPQICTQAKKLAFEVLQGNGFLAVRQWFTWHQGYAPYRGGSRWEQTLVFTENDRFFFSSDRVTTVNECRSLFFRVDMPGHIKHKEGDSFEHIYLSYGKHGEQTLPSTEFQMDFSPDTQNLYQRGNQPLPERFIRAYQVKLSAEEKGVGSLLPGRPEGCFAQKTPVPFFVVDGQPGPWLAGMTLEPRDTYEAWCHQRGYVCLIQELGGWPTKPGDTLGAAYVVGWFDNISATHAAYDRYRGWSGIELKGDPTRPSAFVGVKQKELTPVKQRT